MHWSERVEIEVRRTSKMVGRVGGDLFSAGNRRLVVVRNKGGRVLFQVSLSYTAIAALFLFFFARRWLLGLILIAVVLGFMGYRFDIVRRMGSGKN